MSAAFDTIDRQTIDRTDRPTGQDKTRSDSIAYGEPFWGNPWTVSGLSFGDRLPVDALRRAVLEYATRERN